RIASPRTQSKRRRRAESVRCTRSGRPGKNARRGAVIGNVRDTAAGAPVVIVGAEGYVKRHIPLVPVAETAPAAALAAAIVVGDDGIEAIRRIVARAHPGHGRLHGSRRTGRCGTPATAA